MYTELWFIMIDKFCCPSVLKHTVYYISIVYRNNTILFTLRSHTVYPVIVFEM